MKYIQIIITALFLFFPTYSLSFQTEQTDFENSVIQVIVTYQKFDPYLPWQKKRPGVRYGYGVAIKDGQVITTEGLIRNSVMIELRKIKNGLKFAAEVIQSDHIANIALLKIVNNKDKKNMMPLQLTENMPMNAPVKIIQFDEVDNIQYGDGQLIRVSYAPLPQTAHSALTLNILTDLNVNGQGAAIIYEGRLAGINMTYDKSSRMALVLPYPIIKRFINDVADKPYKGFSSAGFTWTGLNDPAKRGFLKIPQNGMGIMVLSTMPGYNASKVLLPGDVIIECDGKEIDSQGFYKDKEFGRILMPYIIRRRSPGTTIPIKIIRNARTYELLLTLSQNMDEKALIPENPTGKQAEYLVEGGFVIRELDARYLFQNGLDWRLHNNPRLVHLYETRSYFPLVENERIVILSQILPDIINVGYQDFRDEVITGINGKPVKNIRDVFKIVENDGGLERITLQAVGQDLIIDTEALPEANKRISRLYQIPSIHYQRK